MGVLFALWAVVLWVLWGIQLVRVRHRPLDWRWPPPGSVGLLPPEFLSRDQYTVVAIVGVVSAPIIAVIGLAVIP